MKRPPGLWILLSAGLLWLSLEDVDGVRATSLIFAKTSTTTSTTTPAPESAGDEEGDTTEPVGETTNSTKPSLTGVPQLDYVWDPNLPKELNGYNLSDYPFYERVPEDIDFKCDGLHDGFYASVKHKCQVYHHCLFGVRYDFLCANYTAFDQTLFNCNFVSNVDCENSKRFWHRNDELYVTKSTTTTPAPIVYNLYTPPTNLYAGASRGRIPQLRGQVSSPQQIAEVPGQSEQPAGQQPQQVVPVLYIDPNLEPKRRQRPQRRRPIYDYYDDYEERPRRLRPRRPRPPYYDYDDYEEEDRYDRRGSTRRRRPYERRPMMRDNERRRKYDYVDDEDYLEEEYDDLVLDKKKPSRKRKFNDDDDDDVDTRRDRSRSQSKPKPSLGVRRPPSEDYEDELQKSDKTDMSRERSRKSSKEGTYKGDENQSVAKPVGLYDRPRPASRITVPRNSYKTLEESEDGTTTTTATTTGTSRQSTSRNNVRKRPKQTEVVPEPDNMSTSTTSESATVLRTFKRPVNNRKADTSESAEQERPIRVKVPIRLTKLKEKTTEPTPLDTLYDTYDVTLNEASPVADLTPRRSYPTGL